MKPVWLAIAEGDIGLKEIPGEPTAPRIGQWLRELGAWWSGDDVPWCGVAVAAWMQAADIARPKHWYRARAWLDWGIELVNPTVGCVVVYERKGGGHVGLVVGKDRTGNLMTLGGNQGDAVSIKPFPVSRVLGYRWPNEVAADLGDVILPLLANNGPISTNEA